MIRYSDALRAMIDPDSARPRPDGRVVAEISVVMLDYPDRGSWRPPAEFALTPEQAREFACELVDYAELAERIGARR